MTGTPLALVKRFVVDMTVPCVEWRADGVEYFLAGPGRGADHVAEILWPDGGLLAGEHIGFHVGKGRLGLAVDPVVEAWMISSVKWAGRGVGAADSFAFGIGELGKRNGFSESVPSQSAKRAV
jgi:hypothetical protein